MTAVTLIGFDLGAPAGDQGVCVHYDPTSGWSAQPWPAHPADDGIATCTGCGCTDDRACPGSCWWLAVDRKAGKGVCSNCEDHLQAFLDQQEAAARLDAQEAQARERLAVYINTAAEWSLMAYRIETRDIRDRADEAIARHRRVAKAVLRRLDPKASGDPAPRIVDIGAGLVDAFDRAPASGRDPYGHWQAQNLTWWTAENADRRARPRQGARP